MSEFCDSATYFKECDTPMAKHRVQILAQQYSVLDRIDVIQHWSGTVQTETIAINGGNVLEEDLVGDDMR